MTERLFFALWPDEATRAALAQRLPEWSAGLDGRLQRPDQWHITLMFIGSATASQRTALQAAAGPLAFPAVDLFFDRCEYWRKAQVACLVAAQTPTPLGQFIGSLREAVAAVGFQPEPRRYQPHVTIARSVRACADRPVIPPLFWPATGFALVRSTGAPGGSRYEPLHWWNGRVRDD